MVNILSASAVAESHRTLAKNVRASMVELVVEGKGHYNHKADEWLPKEAGEDSPIFNGMEETSPAAWNVSTRLSDSPGAKHD
jgi:hypothetical protein